MVTVLRMHEWLVRALGVAGTRRCRLGVLGVPYLCSLLQPLLLVHFLKARINLKLDLLWVPLMSLKSIRLAGHARDQH